VLSALLVAGVAGETLPLENRSAAALGIGPVDPVADVALNLWDALAAYPVALGAAALAAVAAGILPWARQRSKYGMAVIGAVVTIGAIGAGAGVTSTVALLLVWSVSAAVAETLRRRS
jgi:hypothetical protein